MKRLEDIVIEMDMIEAGEIGAPLTYFCKNCPIYNDDINVVKPNIVKAIDSKIKLLIISDYPGRYEKEEGRAYVGPVGRKVLKDIHEYIGDINILVMNALNHYALPSDAKKQCIYCLPYVKSQIVSYAPSVIWFAGKIPYLLLKYKSPVKDEHEEELLFLNEDVAVFNVKYRSAKFPSVLTVNPALVFRNDWSEKLYKVYKKALKTIKLIIEKMEDEDGA